MQNQIFKREYYLNKIRGFYESDLVKVITGIRRCGKSCFMLSVIDDLKERGISDGDIVYLNLDTRPYLNVTTPSALSEAIDPLISDGRKKYIFIDEVQNVRGFERIVNAYRESGHSLFITGSNSYLLGGELVTKLTGRYIEIEMFTLTFNEYLDMKRFLGLTVTDDTHGEFDEYIRQGGFPKALEFPNADDRALYTQSIIEQIFDKDIARNRKIRNVTSFERVKNFVINNFGSMISAQSIAAALKKEQIAVTPQTVTRYLEILESAKIIYSCPRFDLRSKKALSGEQKYYLADLGIYFSQNVDARVNYGAALENILFCYLKTKGYKLSVGRIGNLECDFITRKRDDYYYIQVAMTIMDPVTEEREYRPFERIRDNYPKYLFTLDTLRQNRNGIKNTDIAAFMRDGKDLG